MKRVLIVLLIIAVVIMIPSCKKKTEEKDEDSSVSSLSVITASTATSDVSVSDASSSPLTLEAPKSLTVATESDSSSSSSPSSSFAFTPAISEVTQEEESKTGSSSDIEVSTTENLVDVSALELEKPLTYIDQTQSVDAGFALNEFYRGGEMLIKASFTSSEGELVFNVDESEIRKILSYLSANCTDLGDVSYVLTGSLMEISYPETAEDEVETKWNSFKEAMNAYNEGNSSLVEAEENELVITKNGETVKGSLSASIYSDRTEISIPEEMTEEDVSAFIEYIVTSYPETLDYGTYSVSGRTVTLVYSALFSNRSASDVFDDLVYLVNTYFSGTDESSPVIKEEETRQTQEIEEISAEPLSEIVEEKAQFISSYSASAFVNPSFNVEKKGMSFSAGLRAEKSINSWFSGLLDVEGNFSYGYLDAIIYGKFTFARFNKVSVYALIGGGIDYSLRGEEAQAVLSGALGFEYSLLDNLSLFAEIGYRYSFLRNSEIYGRTGVRYTF